MHFLSLQLCAFALLFTASLISSGDIPSNSSSSSSLGITTETLSLRSKPTLDLTYASISSGVSPSKGSSSPPNIPFPRMKSNQYFYNSFTPQAIKVLLLKTEKKNFCLLQRTGLIWSCSNLPMTLSPLFSKIALCFLSSSTRLASSESSSSVSCLDLFVNNFTAK